MSPIEFRGVNVIFAETQPEYNSLPACRLHDGIVVSCWKMSWRERFVALITGRIWCLQMTFGAQLQPQKLTVDSPEINHTIEYEKNVGGIETAENIYTINQCDIPPKGWMCSRPLGHEGPCAARPL